MTLIAFSIFCSIFLESTALVDYTGHKVLTITTKSEKNLKLLQELHGKYSLDFWNEPKFLDAPVMIRLTPQLVKPVEKFLKEHDLKYKVSFHDLQREIEKERSESIAPELNKTSEFNFTKYNEYEKVVHLLKDLSMKYSNIAELEVIGKSYEERPIYNIKIGSVNSSSKPAILMECGIHAREWAAVSVCSYIVNQIITLYIHDNEIRALIDKFELNIIVVANPDGYIYTWTEDRLWRKTRSQSIYDLLGICRGADANRNFDISHCGVGSSTDPCSDTYCGDKPFSESEVRALRDVAIAKKDRLKAYFSIHSFSQLWMTPYGYTESLPSNYDDLSRVGKIGVDALARRYGTRYKLGSVANTLYKLSGDSIDYMYEKLGIKMSFTLELRDKGKYGFLLPQKDIFPMCQETWDGIKAALQAL